MKKTLPILLLAAVILLSGCATIVTKSSYDLRIESNPVGADMIIQRSDGIRIFQGKAPTTVILDSGTGYFQNAKYNITVSKPGYYDYVHRLEAKIDGWYFGNLFLGGIIGCVIVDPLTGAMWKIKEKVIYIDLIPKEEAAADGFEFTDFDELMEKSK